MDLKAFSTDIMQDYQTCLDDTKDKAIFDKIETYLDQFQSDAAFDKHIAADLAWWSISIVGEQADLIAKMVEGKWQEAGADAGLMMDKVIIGKNKFAAEELTDLPVLTNDDIAVMAKNFISSALKWEKMDGYVDCGITKPWTQGPILEQAFEDLKSETPASMIKGL